MQFREQIIGFFSETQEQAMGQARFHFDSNQVNYGNTLKSGLKKTLKFISLSILSVSCWFVGLLGFVLSILIRPESLTIASKTLSMISLGLLLVPFLFAASIIFKKL